MVHYNTSSNIEILKFHAPDRESGARSYQIYPSLYADIWFWLLLLIGLVELILGLVGWKKKQPEGEEEKVSPKIRQPVISGKDELPDEDSLIEESTDSDLLKEAYISDEGGSNEDELGNEQ